ncbi:hypothetical protein E2C01_043405 [Portunus trituberculatus]|uniref:Uncharacterized protein n=1 Tax=Portunus trituberculatus TaxID=210409 RepID=A0A5B7FW29_PORTR|nr:hypothetical protein [Portunus trituberculatus]
MSPPVNCDYEAGLYASKLSKMLQHSGKPPVGQADRQGAHHGETRRLPAVLFSQAPAATAPAD